MNHHDALHHLRATDPVLGAVIDRLGAYELAPVAEGTLFEALVRSIVYQQLSGKAAATIHRRLQEGFGDRTPTPTELLATPDEPLRAAGLSRQKIGYLRDLASRIEAGNLELAIIETLEDEEIITQVSRVRGIGRWTVQMMLMFRLGRLDVLPELDLGVQKAIMRAYGLGAMPKPKEVLAIGAKWAPYRTIASWYLWRSLELPAESYQ